MVLLRDVLGLVLLFFLSPWILWRFVRKGKSFSLFLDRLSGNCPTLPKGVGPLVWFHGVSVGEIHLLRQVIGLAEKKFPNWQIAISSSTGNGLAEAKKAFPNNVVFPFPLDFSWAIAKMFSGIKPSLIVLAESELWPNFLSMAEARGIPVAVINSRMSPKTQLRYRWLKWFSRPLVAKVKFFGVQDLQTAGFFRDLDVPESLIRVTGSIKYDGADPLHDRGKADSFKKMFCIEPGQTVLVAGSTQEPEESLVLKAFKSLSLEFQNLRLLFVPRQPDSFNSVATLLQASGFSFARRSQLNEGNATEAKIILVDTLGELRAVWQLADIAFVGGSLDGKRGGQNMIEPAACGAAVFFGPHIWNFKQVARDLLEHGGALKINSAEEIEPTIKKFLLNPNVAKEMGSNARDFVLSQRGASEKTVDLLAGLLNSTQRQAA